MRLHSIAIAAVFSVALAAPPAASPHIEFRSTKFNAGLRLVENSGVCETTPGVHTVSGYIDIAANQSLWFWFFAAREYPESAPFTLWLNGGPGCSSMIGLFQENGPCNVNPDGATTTLNPYSWNQVSNMLYLDQPVGTGFSFGDDTVDSTRAAAPPVWKAFQLLFENPLFSKYQSRKFIFATESYGGHYAPEFVTFFNHQNALIDAKILRAEKIHVSALMINNGWFDPLIQYRSYIEFAADAPGYGPLVNQTVIKQMNETFFSHKGCFAQEKACYAAGLGPASNNICGSADDFCSALLPILGDRNIDDLRQNSSSPIFPPEFYVDFLALPHIKAKIGATSVYAECPDLPFNKFVGTGDDARTFLPELSALVNSKLKVLIWAGDADINCNWVGGHSVVQAMNWYGAPRLRKTPLTNITIDGVPVAAVQNVDNFSFARVYQAGHEVPAYQPRASLEIFKQVIAMEQLHSV